MTMMLGCGKCKLGPNGRLFLLANVVFLYLVIGALIFSDLEQELEQQHVVQLRELREAFAAKVKESVSDEELETFIKEIVDYSQSGILATNNVTFSSSWTFGQSFFFVGTLVTTIGYGHTLPLSDSGKTFAIFYALLGVPLTFVMFSAMASRLMMPLGALLSLLQKKMVNLKELYTKLIHLAIVLSILLVFFFIIPAAIFTTLESGWNYLDSIYYCFISLTTIGLGDYIPGEAYSQPNRAIYKVAVTVYLFIGLICVMTIISVVYNIKELNFTSYFISDSKETSEEDQEKLTLKSDSVPTVYTKDECEPVNDG